MPIHLDGRNGLPFYLASWLHKPASALLLVRQLFRQQGRRISLTLGERIPPQSLGELAPKTAAALVRRHLYRLGKGKKGPLTTEAPIALPEDRRQLKQAMDGCELLEQTPDGQRILLYRRHEQGHSVILRELGRLREIAFRAVGEGSGRRRDLDAFDDDYHHLILWDPARLDIIGAYRFAPVAELLARKGVSGLYSHTLFGFEERLLPRLEQAIELGRSFIQPAYWGKRGLDYLWFGIGAYLARYPQYRYLFGPVTLSGSLPPAAKDLLVGFYRQHFAPELALAPSRRPYPETASLFEGHDYGSDLKALKARLDHLGCAIPTLYKQYSELCEPGGRAVHGLWHRPRLQPLHRRPGVGGREPHQGSQAGPLYRPTRPGRVRRLAATANKKGGCRLPFALCGRLIRLRACDRHGRDRAPGL